MAQLIEISAPSAPTPTAKLFALGSDTVAYTASSAVEATNRNLYVCTFTGVVLDVYLLVLYTAGTKFANRYVSVTAADGTFTEINDPASNTITSSFDYSPVNESVEVQEGTICRGDGAKIRFTAVPAAVVDDQYWTAYLGTSKFDAVAFSVAAGNMEVNEATGVILINPTSAQTAALPLEGVWLELYRTGSGDDNKIRVAKVRMTVEDGLLP